MSQPPQGQPPYGSNQPPQNWGQPQGGSPVGNWGQPQGGPPPGNWGPPQGGQQPYGLNPTQPVWASSHQPPPKSRKVGLIIGAVAALLSAITLIIIFTVLGLDSDDDAGTSVYEGERIAFEVPEDWAHDPQDNVTSVLSGFTVFDDMAWRGFDPGNDDLPREILGYRFYGQETQPRTQTADPALISDAIDQGVQVYRGLSPAELQGLLSSVGHGCFNDVDYAREPERVDHDGLVGVQFEFTCGAGLENFAAHGIFSMFIDEYGDRHQVTFSTDSGNFEEHRDRFEAVFDSIEAR